MTAGWINLLKSKATAPSTAAPLTEVAALAEARRRWPSGAVARSARDGGGHWFHVGVQTPEGRFVAYGSGGKWESAFRDADLAAAQQTEGQQRGRHKGNRTRQAGRGTQRQCNGRQRQ